ncbi:DUF7313 family protein [Haloferacaceae archaeon DSL9]
MDPLQFLVPLGWIEALGDILPIAILVLAVANVLTRYLAHRANVRQAEAGDKDENVARYLPHTVTNFGLVVLALLFVVQRPVSGMIMGIPIAALFIADFFEFEARCVEARNGMPIEQPKSSIVVSSVVLIYAAYYGLAMLYGPYLDLIFT